MLRFLAVFLTLIGLGLFAQTFEPVRSHFTDPFNALLAQAAYLLMSPFDASVTSYSNVLADRNSAFGVSVESGCNGVETVLILWAAMLAFPVSWRDKLMGLFVAFCGIQAINLVRIVSLYYLGQWDESVFTWVHHNLWPLLIIVDGLVIFLLWQHLVAREKQNHVTDS